MVLRICNVGFHAIYSWFIHRTAFVLLSMERGSQEEEKKNKTKLVHWIEQEICGYTVDVLYHKCPKSSKNYRKISILSWKFKKILTHASGHLLSNETTPFEIGSFEHRNVCYIYATSCNSWIPQPSTTIPIYVACTDNMLQWMCLGGDSIEKLEII